MSTRNPLSISVCTLYGLRKSKFVDVRFAQGLLRNWNHPTILIDALFKRLKVQY